MAKRVPKHITKKEDIDFILSIDESKITLSTMYKDFIHMIHLKYL